jgi:putative pyoverdin transport system ATP-binding/permease protein
VRTLYLLLRQSRARLAAAVVVGLISGLGSTILLAMLHAAVTGDNPKAGWRPLSLFLGVCVVVSGARLLSQYLIDRTGQTAVLEMRMRLGRKILSTPLRQLESIGPARLLTVLANDVGTVSNSILIFPMLALNAALVIGCLAYLATLSLPLFWTLLVLLVVVGATYQMPMTAGARRFSLARREQESLLEYFRGLVNGTKELKINRRRQRDFLDRFEESAGRQRAIQIAANLIYGAAGAWGHLIFFIVVALLVYVRPAFTAVPREALVGYTLVLLYMMTPLQSFLGGMAQLGQSSAALWRIEELGLSLQAPPGEIPAEDTAKPAPWRELRLDRVTHRYGDEAGKDLFTLGPLDLRFQSGELVFIVGGNGSGKTTLAKLLLGLYVPATGTVYLDSEPVTDSGRDAYRQNFSAVFSDFYLFDELFGHRDLMSHERARVYLKELKLDQLVELQEGRLSNINVSRGQQKRLALLSAYLEDRPVYLFDEWAADQDPTFKGIFYLEILPELKRRGKTVLVITHDDQYFHVADRVIKLEYGQVRFDGPAPDLLLYTPAGIAAGEPRQAV